MYHLYEAEFESPRMWLKIQASCRSQEQALAFLGPRFGSKYPSVDYPKYSLSVPFRLSDRSQWIANWETIRDHLPEGWDDHEFRLAEGPYPWCETLSNNCSCRNAKTGLSVVYCSDLGLREDATRRARKTPDYRHFSWRQEMESGDANVEKYDEKRLESYWAAVLNLVKSAQVLDGEHDPDCLYLVIRVDRKSPRGEGTLTTVQRDLTDPTGNSQRVSISRYPKWEVCLGILDGLLDDETC